jgi:hypothetical protein
MYSVLSFDFRVLSAVEGVEERVRTLLTPFGPRALRGAPHEFVLTRRNGYLEILLDGAVVHRARRVGAAIDWMLWKASTEAIAGIRDHIAIHAGAVGIRGRAVLLPAPPDSGKTTLTAGLVGAGFSYFSDEAALIDPASGRVVAFPRALWLEPGSVEALARFLAMDEWSPGPTGTAHVAPTALPHGRIGRASPVGHVVFPRYEPNASTRLLPMSRAEGLIELGRNAFNLDRFGAGGVDVLADVIRGADVHRLTIGDLGAAVATVSRLVAADDGRRRHVSSDVR